MTEQVVEGVWLVHADCREAMRAMRPESVDAIATDPPYNLAFMGRAWDSHASPRAFQAWCESWAVEALRVLKPGGHLLAFGGTRTYHRLVCALEDAGFEVRDCVMWLYGRGFPKSLDVAKAIDKAVGAEGEWRREDHPARPGARTRDGAIIGQVNHATTEANPEGLRHVYEPASPEAAEWEGWGTALKPAWEPVVVVRKPLVGSVARNVLEFGVGGINVDACRVSGPVGKNWGGYIGAGAGRDGANAGQPAYGVGLGGVISEPNAAGRWPANLVLSHTPECIMVGKRRVPTSAITKPYERTVTSEWQPRIGPAEAVHYADGDGLETVEAWECHAECPVRLLDEQSGQQADGTYVGRNRSGEKIGEVYGGGWRAQTYDQSYGGGGGASRFFYTSKASTAERNAGASGNRHPTIKPVGVMRWLVRLVTPPGGLVLDPFAGSGTTGIAALLEGFRCVLVEQDAESVATAAERLEHWAEYGEHAVAAHRRQVEDEATGQMSLGDLDG